MNAYLLSEQNVNQVIAESSGDILDWKTQAVGIIPFASEEHGFFD